MFTSASAAHLTSTLIPRESFIFVRHGSTDWSAETIQQGPQNLSLNEQGKAEAASVADILTSVIKDEPTSYTIISSTLQRATETAAIIADKTHLPILLEPDLQERYYGDFSLNTSTPFTSSYLPIDAEPEKTFQNRISTAMNRIFTSKSIKNKKILVSHSEVFKYLSKILTKKEETIPRGGVAMFVPINESNSNQSWTIRYLTKQSLSQANECGHDRKKAHNNSEAPNERDTGL